MWSGSGALALGFAGGQRQDRGFPGRASQLGKVGASCGVIVCRGWAGWLVHCGMFSSVLGLYSLDTSGVP